MGRRGTGQIRLERVRQRPRSGVHRLVADLNSDAGTGRIIGWTAPGREDVIRGARTLTRALLTGLGASTFDDSLRYVLVRRRWLLPRGILRRSILAYVLAILCFLLFAGLIIFGKVQLTHLLS